MFKDVGMASLIFNLVSFLKVPSLNPIMFLYYLYSSSSEESSLQSTVTYTLFKFDVDIIKKEVEFPREVISPVPEGIHWSRLRNYLPPCFHHGYISFNHNKLVGVYCFTDQEACSKLGDKSSLLLNRVMDRKRQKGSYVQLPSIGGLRAAEVFEGGTTYDHIHVALDESDEELRVSVKAPRSERIAYTLPSEEMRTGYLVDHLRSFIQVNNLPLVVNPNLGIVQKVSVFSGGGDVSIRSIYGCVVIGGTDMTVMHAFLC